MAFEYLKQLELSPEVEAKLRALEARSASELLSMLEAAPQRFAEFLGAEEAERLWEGLRELVELERLEKAKNLHEFDEPNPGILPVDIEAIRKAESRRDQLRRDIELLRNSGDTSAAARELLEYLQEQLHEATRIAAAGN